MWSTSIRISWSWCVVVSVTEAPYLGVSSLYAKHPCFTRIPSSPLLTSLVVVMKPHPYMIAPSMSCISYRIHRVWITDDLIT